MQIILDTQSLLAQFNISKPQIEALIDYVVKDITASYARRLERQAKEQLHQTRMTYIRNIKVFDEGRFKGSVLLDYSKNKLVKMLEEGANPFDMKLGFERSDKKHIKANGVGWYLTIPFREANPNAIAESDIFSGGIMPQEIYSIVKEKPADIPTSSGGLKSAPTTLSELPEKFQIPKTRAMVTNNVTNKVFEEYKNKTSIYEGISKMQDPVTGQNTYMSFRRVSDLSDPNSWIHSGIVAHNLMDKALMELEGQLPYELNNSTNNALSILGF